LNALDHYTADIDGLPIHFIHQQGCGPNPIPLIITHGWPGSFVEMLRVIPMLANPAAHGGLEEDAFSVVVPSIPGHGRSGRPNKPRMNYSMVANMWVTLMDRLGYSRFGAQGGDWDRGSALQWGCSTRSG
jgi:pimeloyl-ACP methyl ester carboxylesterase